MKFAITVVTCVVGVALGIVVMHQSLEIAHALEGQN